MKVKKNSIMNMGDTSYRMKNYMQPTKIILQVLNDDIGQTHKWEIKPNNKRLQDKIYTQILDKANGTLQRKPPYKSPDKIGMRGRDITNAVAKIGLVDKTYRRLGTAAYDWLNNKLTLRDKLEQLFPITNDNLVFLRQLLKLRLYKTNKNIFIRPFVFTLKFLSKYQNVSINQFEQILAGLNPDTMNSVNIKNIINDYNNVITNKESFGLYYAQHFTNLKNNTDNIKEVHQLLNNDFPSNGSYITFPYKSIFKKLFYNQKGNNEKSAKDYFNFVNALIIYRKLINNNKSVANIIGMLENFGSQSNIKKAFGYNKIVFPIKKGEDFKTKFANSPLLSGNVINIYSRFIDCKNFDEIREYSDMNRRIFSLSAIFNTLTNHRANIHFHSVWKEIFRVSPIQIYGKGSYYSHDLNINSDFYKDITSEEILGITDDQVDHIVNEIKFEYKIPLSSKISDLKRILQDNNEKTFEKLLDRKFPESKVIQLLKEIKQRCDCKAPKDRNKLDRQIQRAVIPNTSVPTIFEYLLGIAWYYLSNDNINILSSFNLTMDSNFLPLEQAPGGEGDIEIKCNNHTILLLEATLMNRQAQKRGELEPVIRHSANLRSEVKAEDDTKDTQTIFVADELDPNVINIFRDMIHVELNNSNTLKQLHPVNGVNIFSLNIPELIILLKNNENNPESCNSYNIRNIINNNINNNYKMIPILNNWRKPIIHKLCNL